MIAIVEATTETHFDGARSLFMGFFEWMKGHHKERPDLFIKYYDSTVYAAEIASLLGEDGPPGGKLLLAIDKENDNKIITGCVALRCRYYFQTEDS